MKLILASIAPRAAAGPAQALLDLYTGRLATYAQIESQVLRTEAALFDSLARHRARTPAMLVLLDPRGKQLSSEAFAVWIGTQQESGRQLIVFAIGPADGWTPWAREQTSGQSGLLLSLGSMTLPHELARIVLAEQVYRAFTILSGHPYHSGHTGP